MNVPLRIYNHFGRTYLFNLDSYHLKYVNNEGDLMTKKEREKVDARYELEPEHDDFDNKYVVDAYHAGNVRHLCEPSPSSHTHTLFCSSRVSW